MKCHVSVFLDHEVRLGSKTVSHLVLCEVGSILELRERISGLCG